MKARKHQNPLLEKLLNKISPTQMKQTETRMLIAANIADLLKKRGWKKNEFAKMINKKPSEVTKWVSGTHNFTVDVLVEIACVFDVSVSSLVEETNTPREIGKKYFAEISGINSLLDFKKSIPGITPFHPENPRKVVIPTKRTPSLSFFS